MKMIHTLRNLFLSGLLLMAIYLPQNVYSAIRTWNGGVTDDLWSTVDNWSALPVNGDSLVFSGVNRLTNTNDLTLTGVAGLRFTDNGFELNGNKIPLTTGGITNLVGTNAVKLDLTWGSAANLHVATGTELVISGSLTNPHSAGGSNITYLGSGLIRYTGTGYVQPNQNPATIINNAQVVVDGGSFASAGGVRIASGTTPSASKLILTNGATMTQTVSGGAIRVGDFAGITGELIIDNSTLVHSGGNIAIGFVANAIGAVKQNGGTVTNADILFNNATTTTATYDMVGGTLAPTRIRKSSTGTASISFDGSTVMPVPTTASGATFFTGLNTAQIKSGGLTINNNGVNLTVAQTFSGAGALTKTGVGTLTLTGASSYAGGLNVNAAKVVLDTTGHSGGGAISVADSAELNIKTTIAGNSISASALTLGSAGASTLSFDFGTLGNPALAVINGTNLTANGTITINVTGSALSVGTIKLVDYSGTIGGAGFAAFTPGSLPAGVTANLAENTEDGSLDLVITSAPGYRWVGDVNSDWDINLTTNWFDELLAAPSTFTNGFAALFNDSASNSLVTLKTNVAPLVVIVTNNLLAYTLSGSNFTTATLSKSGANSLTLAMAVTNNISSLVLNEGSVVVSNGNGMTFSTPLSDTTGLGTFVKIGGGVLTVSGNNSTFDGNIAVQAGTYRAGASTALGSSSGSLVVSSGGAFDLRDRNFRSEMIVVSGSGPSGGGAIIDSDASTSVQQALLNVSMTGDTTVGGSGRWDIRADTDYGPGLMGNGFKLTKDGANLVSIAQTLSNSPAWNLNLGDIEVVEGTLAFAGYLQFGNASSSVVVHPGARFQVYDMGATNPITRNISITNGILAGHGGSAGINVFTGSIELTGLTNVFEANAATTFLNGTISGTGSVDKNTGGKFLLNGANTYTGDTLVSAGTLGGTGSIVGNLIISGGTFAPGASVGTFTIGGDLTMTNNAVFELNNSLLPNSDRVVVGGTILVGDTLTVTNIGGPLVEGDTFALFNKAITGSFSSVTLPSLAPGLGWINNLAVDGSIKIIGVPSVIDQPDNSTVDEGDNAIFTVAAVGEALSYQWYFGTSEISGATGSSVTIFNVTPADTNEAYSVIVSNVAGFVTSSEAYLSLTADDPPTIVTQPVSGAFVTNMSANFTVVAAGTGLTYQWQKDGLDLADGPNVVGATTDSLTISAITTNDAGGYTVTVSNFFGGVISDEAILAVIEFPTVNVTPLTQNINQGAAANFTANAGGGGLSYQWYHGATLLGGATTSTLTVNNVQPLDIVDGWTVVVTNVAGGVTSTPPAMVTLTLDLIAPKTTVTTPKPKAGTNVASVMLTGIAKDTGLGNSGIITSVRYGVNAGNVLTAPVTNLATVLPAIKPGQWPFTAGPIALTPGTNIMHVIAKDLAGNDSVELPFIFYYDLTNDLVLNIVGEGQVKMGALLWNNSGPITNIFKVGRPYKIDAFVGKGTNFVFTNWTTAPVNFEKATNGWVQKLQLAFLMQEEMTINANFMTNPFAPVVGTYNGLFSENAGVTHESAGFIQVKVKEKSTYSGFLLFDGDKITFSGKFTTGGTINREVSRSKVFGSKPPVQMALAIDLIGNEYISGTVAATNGDWTAQVEADKAVFTDLSPDTTNAGLYTIQIPQGVGAWATSPGGAGYGAISNSAAGIIKFGGMVADGQKLTQKVNISRDGNWPFYVPLYKDINKAYQGSVQGWVKFAEGDFGPSTNNVLNWIKKDGVITTALYPDGFSNSVEMAGSPYVTPAFGATPIPIAPGDLVIVSDGNLVAQTNEVLSVTATATGASKVTLMKTNTVGDINKATIVFKAKDGTFTGGFVVPPSTVKISTRGAVLQNTNSALGAFTNGAFSGTIRVE